MTNPMGRWPVEKVEVEKRRQCILTHLMNTPAYTCSDELLMLFCQERGCPTTDDQVIAAIEWLAELGLVTSRKAEDVIVATLTKAGLSVAQGHRIVSGVLRPGPHI